MLFFIIFTILIISNTAYCHEYEDVSRDIDEGDYNPIEAKRFISPNIYDYIMDKGSHPETKELVPAGFDVDQPYNELRGRQALTEMERSLEGREDALAIKRSIIGTIAALISAIAAAVTASKAGKKS